MCLALGVSRSGLYDHTSEAPRRSASGGCQCWPSKSRSFSLQSRYTYGCSAHPTDASAPRASNAARIAFAASWMEQGLQPLQKRRFRPQTTQSRHAEPIAPNRLQELPEAPQRPNQVWTADLTYIPTLEEGWLYLAAEMDLCSKRIAGWNLDDSLAAPLAARSLPAGRQKLVGSSSCIIPIAGCNTPPKASATRSTSTASTPSMSRKG